MVAEGADQGRAIVPQGFRATLRHVLLHKREVWSFLARSTRVQHAREGQLGVEAAQETVEGGSVGQLLGVVVAPAVLLMSSETDKLAF